MIKTAHCLLSSSLSQRAELKQNHIVLSAIASHLRTPLLEMDTM